MGMMGFLRVAEDARAGGEREAMQVRKDGPRREIYNVLQNYSTSAPGRKK
jgi:hypothetical protein